MCLPRVCVVVSLSLVLSIPVLPQTSTAQTSPQALTLLQNSLVTLTGGKSITDVTLSATVHRIAGSDDESGTATLKALASGAGRVDLTLPSGLRSEILNSTTAPPSGSWSGPDGVSHPIALHNLLTDSAWFFPAFTIALRLSKSTYITNYLGQEIRNGQSVQHISITQVPPSSAPPGGSAFGHLTQVDFYLDATTLMPAVITFNTHPDNDMGLDIPVEVRFFSYQAVGSTQIPFHVQQFLNNSLLLDLQLTNAQLNSGLSVGLFNVQ